MEMEDVRTLLRPIRCRIEKEKIHALTGNIDSRKEQAATATIDIQKSATITEDAPVASAAFPLTPSESQSILKEHAHTILQLIGVTEAIKGGYVLEDYAAPYLQRMERKRLDRRTKLDHAVQTLRQHRMDLGSEQRVVPATPPFPIAIGSSNSADIGVGPHVAAEEYAKSPEFTSRKMSGTDAVAAAPAAAASAEPAAAASAEHTSHKEAKKKGKKRGPYKKRKKGKEPKALPEKETVAERKRRRIEEKKNKLRKKARKKEARAAAGGKMDPSSVGPASALLQAHKDEIPMHQRKAPPTPHPPPHSPSQSVPAPPTPPTHVLQTKPVAKPPKVVPPNIRKPHKKSAKCHHCRESSMHYRRCSYWQINGSQCRKTYCRACLESYYDHEERHGDWGHCLSDDDWHCPSCLNVCQCAPCIKSRKKEEKRNREIAKGGGAQRALRTRR